MTTSNPSLLTHHAYWLRDLPARQRFEKLTGTHSTQVAVLGAGITGLSAAIELLERGCAVTIVEALVVGAGSTGGSTGHLDAHPEMGPIKLVESLGEASARVATEYRLEAIRTIERRSNAASDFQRISAFHYSERKQDEAKLRQQMEAATKIGLSVHWAENIPLPISTVGYEITGMGRFQPMAYLEALLAIFLEKGGKIYEMSIASGPVDEHPTELKVGDGKIRFEHVVCAVHCNYTDAMRIYLQTPAYQSYVSAVRVEEPIGDALFWDNSEPYYYIRRAKSSDGDLIVVGGCDHRTGLSSSQEAADDLQHFISKRFTIKEVVASWSAELFEPTDGLPIIGRVPGKKNVWIATGLSGIGLTWGTAAGKILALQIAGDSTPLQAELSPARFGLTGVATMVGEQLLSANNLAERILPAKMVHEEKLQPGEGKVGMVDGKFTAVCRDRSGTLHRHNPVCVHLGGVVHWNETEQTWDCPVHGGRYANCGARLYGPPESDLVKPDQKPQE